MAWINVPEELRLYKGDICDAHGQLIQGVVRIEIAFDYDNRPKGEVAYGFDTSAPFPQVMVKGIDANNAGHKVVFDAQDILDGKLAKHDGEFEEVITKRLLSEWLGMIWVDTTQAAHDMGFIPKGPFTLLEEVKSAHPIMWQLVEHFLEYEVTAQRSHADAPLSSMESIQLGEFDAASLRFVSTVSGTAFRCGGLPAFELTVRLDGYAPLVVMITTTEVMSYI